MTENREDTADSNNMRHYNFKKRLIHQHDPPPLFRGTVPSNGVKRIKLGSSGGERKSDTSSADNSGSENGEKNNNRKTKKVKRKRKNCRSQFRHESMELIKLGTNTSSAHCKTKNIPPVRTRRSMQDRKSPSSQNSNEQKKLLEILEDSIQHLNSRCDNRKVPSTNATDIVRTDGEIISNSMKPSHNSNTGNGHHLPQMVPDRRINVPRKNSKSEGSKDSKISVISSNLQAQKLEELDNSVGEMEEPKFNGTEGKEQAKTALPEKPNGLINTGKVSPIRISIKMNKGMFGSILSSRIIKGTAPSMRDTSEPTTSGTALKDEGLPNVEPLSVVPCPKKQDALSKVFRCAAPVTTTAVSSAATSAVIPVVTSPVTPVVTSPVTPAVNLLVNSALTVIVNTLVTPNDGAFKPVDSSAEKRNDQTKRQTTESGPKTVETQTQTEPTSKTKIDEDNRSMSNTVHRGIIQDEDISIIDLTECSSPEAETESTENSSEAESVEDQTIQIDHRTPEPPEDVSKVPEEVPNDCHQNCIYTMTEMSMLYDKLIQTKPVEYTPRADPSPEGKAPNMLDIHLSGNSPTSVVHLEPQNSHLSEPAVQEGRNDSLPIPSHNDSAHHVERVAERSPDQCQTDVSKRTEIQRQTSMDEPSKIKSPKPFLIKDIISNEPTNTDTIAQEPTTRTQNPVNALRVQQDSSPNLVSKASQGTQIVTPPAEVKSIVGSPDNHSRTLRKSPQYRVVVSPQEAQTLKSPNQSMSSDTTNIIPQGIAKTPSGPENIPINPRGPSPFGIPRTHPESQLSRSPTHQLTSNAIMNIRPKEKCPIPVRSPEHVPRTPGISPPSASQTRHMDGMSNGTMYMIPEDISSTSVDSENISMNSRELSTFGIPKTQPEAQLPRSPTQQLPSNATMNVRPHEKCPLPCPEHIPKVHEVSHPTATQTQHMEGGPNSGGAPKSYQEFLLLQKFGGIPDPTSVRRAPPPSQPPLYSPHETVEPTRESATMPSEYSAILGNLPNTVPENPKPQQRRGPKPKSQRINNKKVPKNTETVQQNIQEGTNLNARHPPAQAFHLPPHNDINDLRFELLPNQKCSGLRRIYHQSPDHERYIRSQEPPAGLIQHQSTPVSQLLHNNHHNYPKPSEKSKFLYPGSSTPFGGGPISSMPSGGGHATASSGGTPKNPEKHNHRHNSSRDPAVVRVKTVRVPELHQNSREHPTLEHNVQNRIFPAYEMRSPVTSTITCCDQIPSSMHHPLENQIRQGRLLYNNPPPYGTALSSPVESNTIVHNSDLSLAADRTLQNLEYAKIVKNDNNPPPPYGVPLVPRRIPDNSEYPRMPSGSKNYTSGGSAVVHADLGQMRGPVMTQHLPGFNVGSTMISPPHNERSKTNFRERVPPDIGVGSPQASTIVNHEQSTSSLSRNIPGIGSPQASPIVNLRHSASPLSRDLPGVRFPQANAIVNHKQSSSPLSRDLQEVRSTQASAIVTNNQHTSPLSRDLQGVRSPQASAIVTNNQHTSPLSRDLQGVRSPQASAIVTNNQHTSPLSRDLQGVRSPQASAIVTNNQHTSPLSRDLQGVRSPQANAIVTNNQHTSPLSKDLQGVRSPQASAIVTNNQHTSPLSRDLPPVNLDLVPQGKLFYIKRNNVFVRYFDDTQRKLFLNNLQETDGGCRNSSQNPRLEDDKSEVIEMPTCAQFSSNDKLSVEEYVVEMTCVERFMPRDFFAFYKFVTGYQICNDNLPVSFLTFLNVYNTNGLKDLLDRYVESLGTRS